MSFWCMFLDPHLTTYHLNIGVWVSSLFDEGPSTSRVKFLVGYDCHKKWLGIHDVYVNSSIEHVILYCFITSDWLDSELDMSSMLD